MTTTPRQARLAGTGCHPTFIDGDGRPLTTNKYPMRLVDPQELRRHQLAGWACFVHSSMVIRRSAIRAIGGYRNIFRYAEDDDFFLRLLDRHLLTNIPEALIRYRWHDGNTCAPSVRVHVHRAVAMASAHLRLNGLPDAVVLRREPIDGAFLSFLVDALGPAGVPVRLFWIAMLQHYHPEEREKLEEAWRGVLALPVLKGCEDDMKRHWKKCRENFPDVARSLSALVKKWME